MIEVMSTSKGERIKLVSQYGSQPPQALEIEPRKDDNDSRPVVGISPANRLQLQTRRGIDPSVIGPYYPNTPAADAEPGLQFGDTIVACSDPAAPSHAVTELPDDPRFPGHDRHDYFAFRRRMQELAGEPVTLRVARVDADKTTLHDITVQPMYRLSLGMRMQMGPISAIRTGSPADEAKVQQRDTDLHREGDLITAVEVVDGKGNVLKFAEKTLDPVRLPHQLYAWARDLAAAEKAGTITAAERKAEGQPDAAPASRWRRRPIRHGDGRFGVGRGL